MHVSLVNLDPNRALPISLRLQKAQFSGVTGRMLSSERYTDINTFLVPGKVAIRSFAGYAWKVDALMVTMPAKSVVVLELIAAH
jgi:alpha-N-arabinofuranosidase